MFPFVKSPKATKKVMRPFFSLGNGLTQTGHKQLKVTRLKKRLKALSPRVCLKDLWMLYE